MNRDKYGIIGQIQGDGSIEGGDSACWNGHYTYLRGKDAVPYVDTFEVSFGGYVRHPHPEMTNNGFGAHYEHPWSGCISRDQLTGVLAGVIGEKNKLAMLRIMLNHALRGFLFSYNTIKNGRDPKTAKWKMPDITFMDIWAMMLRGFGPISWVFWPLLLVLDLHLLLGAVYDRYFDNKEPDVINFLGKLFVSVDHVPTPVSKLALKFVNKENLLSRLREYWCGWRDNCEIVDLYEKKLDSLL